MGDVGDFFFGSPSEAPSAATRPTILPAQRRLLQETVIPGLEQAFTAIPPEIFPGFPVFEELPPGLTPDQMMSLEALEEMSRRLAGGELLQQPLARGRQALGASAEAISRLASGEFPGGFEEFFRAAVQDPQLEFFQREVLPILQREVAGAGATRGSQARTAAEAVTQDLLTNIGRQRSVLSFQAERAAEDLALRAAGLAPEIAQAGVQLELEPARALGGIIGALDIRRQAETAEFEARRAEFMRQIDEAMRRVAATSDVSLAGTQQTVGLPGLARQSGFLENAFIAFLEGGGLGSGGGSGGGGG